jgi:putative endonuclease
MYYTYVLKSTNFVKYYTGYTNNLEKRLNDHNQGMSLYSKRYKPWNIIYFEEFSKEPEAIRREKYFKTAAGRRWLKKNVNK